MTPITNFINNAPTDELGLLNEVIRVLDYRDMNEFLQDNPGVVDVIFNWIGKQNVPEWNRLLEENTPEDDFDDE
jgi:hypothetical protein